MAVWIPIGLLAVAFGIAIGGDLAARREGRRIKVDPVLLKERRATLKRGRVREQSRRGPRPD